MWLRRSPCFREAFYPKLPLCVVTAITLRGSIILFCSKHMTFDQAHRAIKKGQIAVLSDAVSSSLDVNETNRFGWSLLMLAGLTGNCRVGAFLVETGADLDARNKFGDTAISLASHKGHYRFVRLLVDAGACDVGNPHGHETVEFIRGSSGLMESTLNRTIAEVNKLQKSNA
jgi:ankyrin repeat protein